MVYISSCVGPRFDISHPILITIKLSWFYAPILKFSFYAILRGAILLIPYVQEELSFIPHYLIVTFLLGLDDSNLVTVISNTPFVNVALALLVSTAGLNLRL